MKKFYPQDHSPCVLRTNCLIVVPHRCPVQVKPYPQTKRETSGVSAESIQLDLYKRYIEETKSTHHIRVWNESTKHKEISW